MKLKKIFLLLLIFIITAAFAAGCGSGGNTTSGTTSGTGQLKILAIDAPPPPNVEEINVTITEIAVHSDEYGWQTIEITPQTVDFLKLVNGVVGTIADANLPAGHYNQIRLIVEKENEIVIDGQSYPLTVPSGTETGIKIHFNFTVEENQLVEIFVDFDASKSITYTPNDYKLRPSFRAFAKVVSGTLAGTVKDGNDTPIPNALVEAVGTNETISTLTDENGQYKLILVEGTYTIQASADGYSNADTTYSDVEVNAEDELTGYDFVLSSGQLRIHAIDAPPPIGVEAINVTITEVAVHSEEYGWHSIVITPQTVDFLQLVNGVSGTIADANLPPGHYDQIRLVVEPENEIVIDGESNPLRVPSGSQTGIKIHFDFNVQENQIVEIYVDFDASKSITYTPNDYKLRPSFRAFLKVVSGTLAGTVKDGEGTPIPNALVEAVGTDETISTLTDENGQYKLILVEGTYTIQASADGFTTADTTYADVEVNAGDELTGYDFVLTP